MEKISIIIPSYNQGTFIEQTILSLLTQKDPNLEIIVVDGGSTDSTLEILKKYRRHITYISEPDHGQSDAVNKGFDRASGRIVSWLNSDDLHLPHTLENIRKTYTSHPKNSVFYGDYHMCNSSGRIFSSIKVINFDPKILFAINYIPQPTVFFEKKMLEKTGKLDDSLHYAMDLDLWFRFVSAGAEFYRVPSYLATIRFHTNAKTIKHHKLMLREMDLVRKRYSHIMPYKNTSILRAYLRTIHQLKRLYQRRQANVVPLSYKIFRNV